MQLILNRAHIVAPSRPIRAAIDPSDDKFLECADAAPADYLLTGNSRHFPGSWKRTEVISPREFIGLVSLHLLT